MPLRPYGSKKLRPFGARRTAPDPLDEVRAAIERTTKEHDALVAEEARLFALVEKYDRAGKKDTNKAIATQDAWDAAWKRLNRMDAALHQYSAQERAMSNGNT